MLKIIILLSFITIIYAKLNFVPDFWYVESFNSDAPVRSVKIPYGKITLGVRDKNFGARNDKLWVVNLECIQFSDVALRSATSYEEEDYKRSVQTMIDRYELRRGSPKVEQAEPSRASSHETVDENETKNEILRIVNKYILHTQSEPDSNISDLEVENKAPTLVLYFKGPYTTLILKYGYNQWHYFIPPPSPLPHWFYGDHPQEKTATYVHVPDDVKKQFYVALLTLLQKFLSIPL